MSVTAIRIATLGIATSDVAPMGLDGRNVLQVPPLSDVGQLGWYRGGPVPGNTGPAVVVAHVDGLGRPGLFANLDQIQRGAQVQVDRSDGLTATFTVTKVFLNVDKNVFPTSLVYGDTNSPQLRLITCGGQVDRVHHRYLGNTIVLAELTSLTSL